MSEEPEWFRKEREAYARALKAEPYLKFAVRQILMRTAARMMEMARSIRPKADYSQ
jgi:hypothetical protein